MALPGKENPFTKGLTEKAPLPGVKAKKSFVKIPLSTGAYSPPPEVVKPASIRPADVPTDQTIAIPAIAESTPQPVLAMEAQARSAPVKPTIAIPAIGARTIATTPIAPFAIANTTIVLDGERKATKVEYAIAKTAIADLADKRGGYTRVDNYVFDVLMPRIGSAPAAIIYLYLWRRSLGFQRLSVSLSHQIIADAVGLSKRTVQEGIAKLNELGVVRTHRAYETAIPEHYILRPWAASTEAHEQTNAIHAIANDTTASAAIAPDTTPYSGDCHTAIAEAATTKRKLNKETKSLSQTDNPELWTQFTAQLTEKARERANRVFQSLKTQFPNDPVTEIAECPQNLKRFGAPDGTPWEKLSSPIGLMESSWPQLREYFRKRLGETAKLSNAREQLEADRKKAAEQDRIEAEEGQHRRDAFFAAFPDEQGRREVVHKYLVGLPFKPDSKIGQGIAIGKWWEQTQVESERAEIQQKIEQSLQEGAKS